MAGGHIRVTGMNHQRNPQGLEIPALQFRSCRGRRWRQAISVHVRKIDTGLFKNRTLLKYAGTAATTGFTLPFILPEACAAILRFQGMADVILQSQQVFFDLLNHRVLPLSQNFTAQEIPNFAGFFPVAEITLEDAGNLITKVIIHLCRAAGRLSG